VSEPQRTTGIGPDVFEPPNPAALSPAAFGRYQVQRALGAVGFGAVYVGHDSQLDRSVAIKVLHAGPGRSQVEGERALQESDPARETA
jgi:serine/threonine protein kinase